MATLWTLGSAAQVIWRRCISETRPAGWSTTMETASRPRKASIAAAPVSPEVAARIVADRPRLRQHRVQHPRHHLQREVLEGERGAVEQLLQPEVGPELDQRRGGGMVEAGVALLRDAHERRTREGAAGEARHDGRRHLGIGPAAQAFEGGGIERRPALGQVEAAVRRGALEQGVLERDRAPVALPRADVAQAALSVLVRPLSAAVRLYAPAAPRQGSGRSPAGNQGEAGAFA